MSLWKIGMGIFIALLVVLLSVGEAVGQTIADKRTLPDTLKVMTYNVLFTTPDEGTIQALRASDADIIGLQEVSGSRLRYIARKLL